jgi:hypothetical protein
MFMPHVQTACPNFMSMQQAHVNVACPCSKFWLHVHAAYLCFMLKLHITVAFLIFYTKIKEHPYKTFRQHSFIIHASISAIFVVKCDLVSHILACVAFCTVFIYKRFLQERHYINTRVYPGDRAGGLEGGVMATDVVGAG